MEDVVNQEQLNHNLGDEKIETLPFKSDNLKPFTRKQIKSKTKKLGMVVSLRDLSPGQVKTGG